MALVKSGLRLMRHLAGDAYWLKTSAGSPEMVAWVATAEEWSRGEPLKKPCSPSTLPPTSSSTSSSLELPLVPSVSAGGPACSSSLSTSAGSRGSSCTSSRSTYAISSGPAFFRCTSPAPGMGLANSIAPRTSSCFSSRVLFSTAKEGGHETSSIILKPATAESVVSFSTYVRRLYLPPITRLSYDGADPNDWISFLTFFNLYDPFPEVPPDGLYTKRLSTDLFRGTERDIVKLVALNKKIGYDIADDLVPDNISVSMSTGMIMLNSTSCVLTSPYAAFMGYKAAGHLIGWVLDALDPSVKLSDDNMHFLSALSSEVCDDMLVNHASLLGRAGRIGLTLKLSMLLRNDLRWLSKRSDLKYLIHDFYQELPYTTDVLDRYPTDEMHQIFHYMRKRSNEFKDQDRTVERLWQEQNNLNKGTVWKSITGNWVSSVNRNLTMHLPGLSQLQAVDVLHSHTSLYLPKAQFQCSMNNWFHHLGMKNFFPER